MIDRSEKWRLGGLAFWHAVAALGLCGCGWDTTAQIGVAEVVPAASVRLDDPGRTVPCHFDLGWSVLARRPVGWQVTDGRRRNGARELHFITIHREGKEPVDLVAWEPEAILTEQLVRRAIALLFEGRPEITVQGFLEKYPSDWHVAAACADLSPGDPAREGRSLTAAEQEQCVLGRMAWHYFLGSTPVRFPRGRLEFFAGGRRVPGGGHMASLLAFDEARGIPAASFLARQDGDGDGLDDFMQTVVRAAMCLERKPAR